MRLDPREDILLTLTCQGCKKRGVKTSAILTMEEFYRMDTEGREPLCTACLMMRREYHENRGEEDDDRREGPKGPTEDHADGAPSLD